VRALGTFAASASHRGRRHADNQDAVQMIELPQAVAIALADGVSTSVHARAAADAAVATALDTLSQNAAAAAPDRMTRALAAAHAAICRLPNDPSPGSTLAEPQATIALAMVESDRVWCGWVGDSRIYLLGATDPRQITVDDSWLAAQVANGMPMQAALQSPEAHCITQCLGMRDELPEYHVVSAPIARGDTVLLCSDGLWGYCGSPADLKTHIGSSDGARNLSEQCVRMIDLANARGGQDNVTIALYRHR
jgi:serine/threonine protein phosphatase PrpC